MLLESPQLEQPSSHCIIAHICCFPPRRCLSTQVRGLLSSATPLPHPPLSLSTCSWPCHRCGRVLALHAAPPSAPDDSEAGHIARNSAQPVAARLDHILDSALLDLHCRNAGLEPQHPFASHTAFDPIARVSLPVLHEHQPVEIAHANTSLWIDSRDTTFQRKILHRDRSYASRLKSSTSACIFTSRNTVTKKFRTISHHDGITLRSKANF